MASTGTNKQPLLVDRVFHEVVDLAGSTRTNRTVVLRLLAATVLRWCLTQHNLTVASLKASIALLATLILYTQLSCT